MTCYEDLMYRGLIKDMTNNEDFVEKLNEGNMTFYWGTDPTADSLTIGHYSSLLTAKRLMKYGHHPILLVGGATGLIGDPRPTAEREIIDKSVVEKNIEGIKAQVSALFDGNVEIVNNYDWIKDFTFIDFLRDVGKYINVNYMLNKDIISRRLETGITYAEFSYTLLQGYDFVHLYKEKGCIMQAAGSDQWGNITTGVELINKMLGKEAYAFTMPIITDASGKKMGKSEGNALWLDKNRTSPYDIYQYMINTTDEIVEQYLKYFTFLDKDEIDAVMAKHNEKPEDRYAQKTLAYEFVKDLHGEEEANQAKAKSEALFGGSTENLEATPITPESRNILDIMMAAELIPSKSEGRRLVEQGGVSIDNEKVTDPKFEVDKEEFVLAKGKKKVVKLVIK
ncbi:MAG: tyrosine--tRNA ligase [Bacilli bacterium]|nr:tyrosine--tRNA ligase [Bacilli bacterium]